MKYIVLLLLPFTLKAQTTPPTVAKLAAIYTSGDTIALNDYGKLLGYGAPLFGFPDVGNTYMYEHFTFSSKDTSRTKDYLTYTYGEHYPMRGYMLASISYGTNNEAIYNSLIDEIKALGATEHFYKDGDPYYHLYQYKGLNISSYQNNHENAAKYNIHIGGKGR